jgi:hypothetical protein
VSGLSVESTDAYDGTYAAESIGDGTTAAYAYKTLPSAQSEIYYELHFKVVSQSSNVYLLWLRTGPAQTGGAAAIAGIYVSNTGKLGYRDQISGATATSTSLVADGQWHTLQVHLNITTGQMDTWLDGNLVPLLGGSGLNLGSTPVGIVQLGENQTTGRTAYDVRYDDVVVDTTQLP